jgi:putative ABC transport system substrate-binding protein
MRRCELMLLLGGVMIASTALRAEQKTVPVIGYLNPASPGIAAAFAAAFRQGLSETGYVEGQTLAIEYRWAEGQYGRLPELAADLVSRNVDVVAAASVPAALAAKNGTSTIPIVFAGDADPVGGGLVASLAAPGGDLTGVTLVTVELWGKRVELISELVPAAGVIAHLVNPNFSGAERNIQAVREAARAKRLRLRILKAGTESEIDAAFASLNELHADALLVGAPSFLGRREQIVALAARYTVPAIYEWREFAAAGGLISYGTSLTDTYRNLGTYVANVLKGARPAYLPVQQPTTFELVVNLKTAQALGLTIPPSILARADEIIE